MASRRSSITTPKLVTSSGFRLSSRSDAHAGGSPRPSTAPDSDRRLDDTRPTSTTGVVSMSASKSYDRALDSVRGDGDDDGDGDTFRIDPIPLASRSSSAKDSFRSSDSSGHGATSQHASKPSLQPHLGTKEDNATLNWNGARSYSSRRSSSFDGPVDNSLGRSHSFSGLFFLCRYYFLWRRCFEGCCNTCCIFVKLTILFSRFPIFYAFMEIRCIL